VVRRVAIIQGHPDATRRHLCHALAEAYASSARAAGHEVREIDVAALDFPVLRSKEAFETGALPTSLAPAQAAIEQADHLLIVYPLWLGTMPALLKVFFEQVLRPGFAFDETGPGRWDRKLVGRTARIVVTMGMPSFLYKWYFRAHGIRSFERNVLGMVGIGPIHETLLGMVGSRDQATRERWLVRLTELGRRGA
jgi:putative NADPH-quinone reductase